MKSLNKCISFSQQSEKLTPTRYWEIYSLTDTDSLLLHLLTGAIDLLNKEEIHLFQQMFESGEITNFSDEMKDILVGRGYLSNPKSEQAFIDNLAECHQKQVREKSIEFFICPTFTCPVGCSYCFENDLTHESKASVISSEQITSIFSSIKKIKEDSGRPVKEIVLFGGEPLLPITRFAVRDILQRSAKQGFKVSVCTSGIFGSEFTSLFCEFSDTVSVVRITIDGPKKYHNTLRTLPNAFERTVTGVDDLLEAKIPVMVRTNVGSQNLNVIPEMAKYFVEHGWTNHTHFDAIITGIKDRGCAGDREHLLREDELAVRFLEMRATYEAVRRLRPVNIFMSLKHLVTNLGHFEGIVKLQNDVTSLDTMKFHGCGATDGALFVFGADSEVYTCTEAIGKPFMSVGKYHPQLALDSNRANKWQGWYKYKIPECRECKYLLLCGGTCTMSSVAEFGSGSNPICPQIRDIIGGYVSTLAKRIELTS